jgi:pimeloyl-ACP methyl ester carboxylesterase
MQDLYFPTIDFEKLHVRHYEGVGEGTRTPVLLVHGAVENGRIFYSDSGKGLAPFLAQNGYDTYVLDFRGRGLSTPRITRRSLHGQTELITEDLPTVIKAIKARSPSGARAPIWIGHSWGGVLLLSMLARFPEYLPDVSRMVFFGTKRAVRVQNFEKWFKIDFGWKFLASLLTRIYGYLPGREWKMGSDQETLLSHAHSREWVISKDWIDPADGFNYRQAIRKIALPPILSVVGDLDLALGHHDDVKRFLEEAGAQNSAILRVPFGHVDMLSSAEAREKVFPQVLNWIRR